MQTKNVISNIIDNRLRDMRINVKMKKQLILLAFTLLASWAFCQETAQTRKITIDDAVNKAEQIRKEQQ